MNILNPDVAYTPAAKTDVSRTLKRHGWTPPSEDKDIQKSGSFTAPSLFETKGS